MIDILWEDANPEERKLIDKWESDVNELIRAYKNKEISKQKYGAWKRKYLKALDTIEEHFSKELQEQHDYIGWKDSWETYKSWKTKEDLKNG